MPESKNVIINSRKFDGKIHKSWSADLIEQTDTLLVFIGVFEEEVKHSHLGVIRRGTVSYEFYWLDRWFNVFRFHQPEGELRNFYCNVNMPPKFEDGVLDYIDLDIDVLVFKDFTYQILDVDEFEENSKKYKYPKHLKQIVDMNVKKLIDLIDSRKYPFGINSKI